MLSYQHEFHAGNHADILKHICLVLILQSLCKKDKPFTVIDSHSGAGIFKLDDERLQKTGEAREGIEKIWNFLKSSSLEIPQGVKSYLELEKTYLEKNMYAGTPEIELNYARPQDTVHLVDRHPQAFESLKQNVGARKATLHFEDSYKALLALTPPLVKRGLVICDPSFEDASDYIKVTDALKAVHKKWNTAVIALWYPLLKRRKNETAQMLASLEDYGKLGVNPCESFWCELEIENPDEMDENSNAHLYGSGMFIMNPPWQLKDQLEECRDFIKQLFEKL